MKINSIALFCGSSEVAKECYKEIAVDFGKNCASRKLTLIYGGAGIGLMGKAAHAAVENGGEVIGIAPDFFASGAVLSEQIQNLILVKSMSERKQLFEQKADAFVALPGSYGTMNELFEVITNAQLGMHAKPVVLLNAYGFYDHLIAQLQRFKEDGLLRDFHYNLLLVAHTIPEFFSLIDHYQYSNSQNWLDKIRK
ncbi:MAG: TIGR00730 family Rossman fold protein [Bacteroidales bacterium]|jgi:uncharacterized protein (TIGR00730 family)|nr:TIGR00730 family Rossman fold protein [Bacteroidales bacterium]